METNKQDEQSGPNLDVQRWAAAYGIKCSAEKLNCICELIFQCLVLSTTTRLFATIKEATCSHQLTTKRCYNDAISRSIDQTSDWVFSVLDSVTVTPCYTFSAQVTDYLSLNL